MTSTAYKAILFDLDGTLLDTADDLGAALNHVLQQHGQTEVAREVFRPIASDGAKGLLTLGFGDRLSTYDYEALRIEFLQFYQDNIAVHTCLYPGVKALLSQLDAKKIPWGIVTNKPEKLAQQLMPFFREFSSSQILVGGDTLSQRKPHPAPLLFACEKLLVSPPDCIYVGDAPRDIEAGNRANMFTVIAQWGYIANTNECRLWAADLICASPKDVLLALQKNDN